MKPEPEHSEARSFDPKVQKVLQFRTLVLLLARGLLELSDTGSISEGVRRDCTRAIARKKNGLK